MSVRLSLPVLGPVSQLYGKNPAYYAQFGLNGHPGVDWAVPVGTSVYNMAGGGTVIESGLVQEALGLSVMLWHPHEGAVSCYNHLDSCDVEVGDTVQPGQLLGKSGKTGTKSPHLDTMFGFALPGHVIKGIEDFHFLKGRHEGMNGWVDQMPMFKSAPKILDSAWGNDTLKPNATPATQEQEEALPREPDNTHDNAPVAAPAANSARPASGDPFEPTEDDSAVAKGAKLAGGNVRKVVQRGGIGMVLATIAVQIWPELDMAHIVQFVPVIDEVLKIIPWIGQIIEMVQQWPEIMARLETLEAMEVAPAPVDAVATAVDTCTTVVDGVWNLRAQPGGIEVGLAGAGDTLCLVDTPPMNVGGHTWVAVTDSLGNESWIAGEALPHGQPVR